ncbi:MAG: DUF262 domain-containing protein [Acidobacteriota bacterium]|nr:DUF262 domain-containing protein [Acidobacteriota bacterium]
MKISDILASIDAGTLTLPQFQRGFVWNRDQVRALFSSLYRRHPVGGLLIWVTGPETAAHRGDKDLPPGAVKLLLDGQQRLTTLYGVLRGTLPPFFDGDERTLTGLRFHLRNEVFEFHQPVKMRDDPLWIDVTGLMKAGKVGPTLKAAVPNPEEWEEPLDRLSALLGIRDIPMPQQELVGEAMTLDIVVDIFNQVNSGGTTLSKGDLALSRICGDWPEAREEMKSHLARWKRHGYKFKLDWLLRTMNTVLTGRAEFSYLRDRDSGQIRNALERAAKQIDSTLGMIADRTGLDHARVLFGPFAVPVMARYLDRRHGQLSPRDWGKLLFWYLHAGMWGRFSGSTETKINEDIHAVETGGLDGLIEKLRAWRGGFQVEPQHFDASTVGARFYPVLYFLTRVGEAQNFCDGVRLKTGMLGTMARLELHHIFPKKVLRDAGYEQRQINALANFCFLTKACNLHLGADPPQEYFPRIASEHPGALESQWIPMDPRLWCVDRYPDFLAERRALLAAAANRHLAGFVEDDDRWTGAQLAKPAAALIVEPPGGIKSEDERETLEDLQDWMRQQKLPEGELSWDLADETTGEQLAVVDLAWPRGIQEGLTGKVAVLIDEDVATHRIVARAGFRCFDSVQGFQEHVRRDVLVESAAPESR